MLNIKESPSLDNVKRELNSDIADFIKYFYDILKEVVNEDDLSFFFNNVDSLKLNEVAQENMASVYSLAEYNVSANIIQYIKDKFLVAIDHELLHLSSSYMTDDCQFSGFSQINKNNGNLIGIGLNEGYTCVLDEKYYANRVPEKMEYLKDTYMIIKQIARMVEDLIGEENMKKWYFNADLKSLVDALSQYMDYEEVICFLLAIDNIFYYCDEGTLLKPRTTMINYRYAVEFIGMTYVKMFAIEYAKGNITETKYNELMQYVYQIISKELKFKKHQIIGVRKMKEKKFKKIAEQERLEAQKKYPLPSIF